MGCRAMCLLDPWALLVQYGRRCASAFHAWMEIKRQQFSARAENESMLYGPQTRWPRAWSLLFGLLLTICSGALLGQENRIATSFEVISIKLEDPGRMPHLGRIAFSQDSYEAESVNVISLLKSAYGVGDRQILGVPDKLRSAKFEIKARIDTETAERLREMDEGARKAAQQRLLQSLLRERFNLSFHRGSKELPIYTLTVAKSGPKLKEARPGDDYANGLRARSGQSVGPHMMLMRLGGGRIAGQGVPLEYLIQQLSNQLQLPVKDETSLSGNYDFILEWTPEVIGESTLDSSSTTPHDGLGSSSPSGPSLFTALEEQLGLRLEVHEGSVGTVVIDHLEFPMEN